MNDSSLNATEIAVGSLLAGNRGYGNNGGAWGGGYGGYPFADAGSNAVRLNRNAQFTENQADCTRDVINQGIDRIASSFENAERSRQFTDLRDGQFRQELRQSDQLAALSQRVEANAREAALCCCDLKKQMCEDKAEIIAEVKAIETRQVRDQLDVERAQRVALETRVSCGCVTGCTTPCNNS